MEVRTPGPPPSRSHVAKFSAETGWLGDFANSGKHLLAEPINPAQARMKPQEHSRDHISVTVARMNQRVRAKRGPMTGSAICGIPDIAPLIRATVLVAAICFLTVISSPAHAQSCTVTNASGSYGSINVLSGGAIDITSTFTVNCSGNKNKTVRLCIEMAAGSTTDAGKRALSNGTKYLNYEFYSDASRTQLWGSWGAVVTAYGSGGITQDLPFGGNTTLSHTFTVYARVLANQQAAAPLSYTWSATRPASNTAIRGRRLARPVAARQLAGPRPGRQPCLRIARYRRRQ